MNNKPFLDRRKLFLVKETNANDYELATCCKPIPGQHIFGVLLGNRKVRIHSVHCSEGENILSRYGGRIVEAEWYNAAPVEVELHISFLDDKAMFPAILNVLKPFKVQSFFFSPKDDSHMQGYITAVFKDNKAYKKCVKRLEQITGVIDIYRT